MGALIKELRERSGTPQMALSPLGPLWRSAKIFGAVNSLGLAVSLASGSHLHLDLLGTGAFAVSALCTLGARPHLTHILSAGSIGLWSAKLAGFLFYRALQVKHDGRLEETLGSTSGCVGFWGVSTLWGVVVMMPHNLAIGQSVRPSRFGLLGVMGLGLFTTGLIVETLSDYQKWQFKSQTENRGKFCDAGLWSMSQHPNYVGNLLIWIGIVVMNSHNLVNTTVPVQWSAAGMFRRNWRLGLAIWSPLFMYGLFTAQATGMLMDSVAMAEHKYGDDPRYAEYVSNTPALLPRFF